MAVAKKTFEFFFNRLVKGFIKDQKRQPNNLEMILIKQEARNKAVDANKVIEVNFDPKNTWKDKKGITSLLESGDVKVGKAPKTPPYEKSQADIEFEIMEKINSDNAKAIRAFESRNPKNKMTEIEEAIDNASPGFVKGDRKYNAQLVADDLAEKRFGKEFYDLDQKQQMDLYDEAYQGLSKKETAKSIEEGKKIKPYDPEGEAQFNKDVEEAGGMEAFLDANPISDDIPKKAGKGQFTKAEYLIQRLRNTIKENPDDAYVQENFPNFIKELEANPDLAKNENVFRELGGDLPDNQKITVYDDDTLDFATLQPTKKFSLNKEKFQKDFNVSDEELEKILALSPEEQQKVLREYIDKDFKQQIELSDFDVTDKEPNAQGGIVGLRI